MNEAHREHHRRAQDSLDDLVTDYLRHHPDQALDGLLVQTLLEWADEQAQDPTEPGPRNGDHHNGTVNRG